MTIAATRTGGDRSGSIARSIPCRTCAYDLEGLPTNALCPECATPVAHSLRADFIAFADPAWGRRVARGVTVMAAGACATAISLAWLMLLGVFVLGVPAGAFWLWFAIEALFFLSGLSCNVVGALLATAPEPRERGREARRTPRRLFRAAAFVAVGVTLLIALCVYRNIPGTALFGTVAAVGAIYFYLDRALAWLAAISRRLPNRRLVTSAVDLRRDWWVVMGIQVLLVGTMVLVAALAAPAGPVFQGVLAWGPLLVVAVATVAMSVRTAGLVLAVRRRLLRRVRRAAA